ncbi:hypothetical protein [uncultured Anaerococcus sp.]|uniref:hypothetical protein n=1 Tax=uncultured Anaerococcus sp. TaxID=293428 RepID=UPI002889AF71|nr:hypothetical protein [uncultured Anaerococcus sp.]
MKTNQVKKISMAFVLLAVLTACSTNPKEEVKEPKEDKKVESKLENNEKAKQEKSLSFTFKLKNFNLEKSTPLILKIKEGTKENYSIAKFIDNTKKSEDTYLFEIPVKNDDTEINLFVPPVNEDGSIYEISDDIIKNDETIELKLIPSNEVNKNMVSKILDNTKLAIEKGCEELSQNEKDEFAKKQKLYLEKNNTVEKSEAKSSENVATKINNTDKNTTKSKEKYVAKNTENKPSKVAKNTPKAKPQVTPAKTTNKPKVNKPSITNKVKEENKAKEENKEKPSKPTTKDTKVSKKPEVNKQENKKEDKPAQKPADKPSQKPTEKPTVPEKTPEEKPTIPEKKKVWVEPVYKEVDVYEDEPVYENVTETYTEPVTKQVVDTPEQTIKKEKWSVMYKEFAATGMEGKKAYNQDEFRQLSKELYAMYVETPDGKKVRPEGWSTNFEMIDEIIEGPLSNPDYYQWKEDLSTTETIPATYKTITENVEKTRTVRKQVGTKKVKKGTKKELVKEGYWKYE